MANKRYTIPTSITPASMEAGLRHLAERQARAPVAHLPDVTKHATSRRMKTARQSNKKINHTSGCTPFIDRAKKFKEIDKLMYSKCVTFMHVYKTNDPEGAATVKAMAEAAANIYSTSQVSEEGSTELTTLPLEAEINIIESVRPRSKGTTVSGLGGSVRRTPKPRGGPRTSSITTMQIEQRAEAAERKAEEAEKKAEEAKKKAEEAQCRTTDLERALSEVE